MYSVIFFGAMPMLPKALSGSAPGYASLRFASVLVCGKTQTSTTP